MVTAGCMTTGGSGQVLTDVGNEVDQTEREIREAIAGALRAEGVAL